MAKHYSHEYTPAMDERRITQLLLHRDNLDELAEYLDPEDARTTKMDLERELERINQALAKLPAKKQERIEVYLFGVNGVKLNQSQQAEYFGTQQPNVKRDFLRALDHLVRLMEHAGAAKAQQEPHDPHS